MRLSLSELQNITNTIVNNVLNDYEGNELYINIDGANDVQFIVGDEVIVTKSLNEKEEKAETPYVLPIELRKKLQKVYDYQASIIDILQVSGISSDEMEQGMLFEDMTKEDLEELGAEECYKRYDGTNTTTLYGIEVTTTYKERDHIRKFFQEWFDKEKYVNPNELLTCGKPIEKSEGINKFLNRMEELRRSAKFLYEAFEELTDEETEKVERHCHYDKLGSYEHIWETLCEIVFDTENGFIDEELKKQGFDSKEALEKFYSELHDI